MGCIGSGMSLLFQCFFPWVRGPRLIIRKAMARNDEQTRHTLSSSPRNDIWYVCSRWDAGCAAWPWPSSSSDSRLDQPCARVHDDAALQPHPRTPCAGPRPHLCGIVKASTEMRLGFSNLERVDKENPPRPRVHVRYGLLISSRRSMDAVAMH